MKLIQLTPGAGPMYCGNCLRDNRLVAALRELGHQAVMAPLYLPLTLDEADQSVGAPILLGGINVYLEQKFAFFRAAPAWLRRSDQAVTWARTMLTPRRAVVIAAEADVYNIRVQIVGGRQAFRPGVLSELADLIDAHDDALVVTESSMKRCITLIFMGSFWS